MNQKEYELIAGVLNYNKPLSEGLKMFIWQNIVRDLTSVFELEYPKTFDRDKFLKACGL